MRIHFVESMDEVLKLALERQIDTAPLTPATAGPVEVNTSHGDGKVTH